MKVNRELIGRILRSLRQCYPEWADVDKVAGCGETDFIGTIVYLREHGLIDAEVRVGEVINAPPCVYAARINKSGLDYLDEHGGLSTVTVRFDAEESGRCSRERSRRRTFRNRTGIGSLKGFAPFRRTRCVW